MIQHSNPISTPRAGCTKFTLKDAPSVELFLRMFPAHLKKLFPELDVKGSRGDAFNLMLCISELAINLRHMEEGKNFFPATFTMERKGNRFVAEMKEASEFFFAGIKPQANPLIPNGRGTWTTHVLCEATGGNLEVKPELGLTRFEYVVGLPQKEVDAKVLEISNRELPLAETISLAAGMA